MVTNHNKDKQFTTLLPVLKDYSIIQKLRSIVYNNASSNDTLYYKIKAYLLKEEEIKWDFTYRRIRYTSYIINLAI